MRIRFCITVLLLTSIVNPLQAEEAHREVAIWTNGLPAGAVTLPSLQTQELLSKSDIEHIRYVETPTLTLYPADESVANGCCVVIFPGGGYNVLAWKKEGLEIAEWFNSIGVSAAVLKYRVPRRVPDRRHLEPLQDAQRAVRFVRHHAVDWNVNPARIGVLGFSAGGHLTLMTGMHFAEDSYPAKDEIDKVSPRPDFMCPIYAAYQGVDYADTGELGDLIHVTKETPPTFLAVTADDSGRGAHAAQLFLKLYEQKVPAELHVYEQGGHGYGIRPSNKPVATWNLRLAEWMRVRGLLKQQ